MKRLLVVLLVFAVLGLLAWIAAGTDRAESVPPAASRAVGAPAAITRPISARNTALPASGHPAGEPAVPPEVIAPIATVTASPAAVSSETTAVIRDPDAPRPMIIPVQGVERSAIHDMFDEVRGNRRHEAIDILAPRGTPVIAADDGVVMKLFTSGAGGLTVYQFDPDGRFCYYYAHLDGYAAGLHQGQVLRRGEVLGYVGTTGNAPKNTPHLHFALIRLDPDRRWWKGTYVNPYPQLR